MDLFVASYRLSFRVGWFAVEPLSLLGNFGVGEDNPRRWEMYILIRGNVAKRNETRTSFPNFRPVLFCPSTFVEFRVVLFRYVGRPGMCRSTGVTIGLHTLIIFGSHVYLRIKKCLQTFTRWKVYCTYSCSVKTTSFAACKKEVSCRSLFFKVSKIERWPKPSCVTSCLPLIYTTTFSHETESSLYRYLD